MSQFPTKTVLEQLLQILTYSVIFVYFIVIVIVVGGCGGGAAVVIKASARASMMNWLRLRLPWFPIERHSTNWEEVRRRLELRAHSYAPAPANVTPLFVDNSPITTVPISANVSACEPSSVRNIEIGEERCSKF